jgi:hypothetical protein
MQAKGALVCELWGKSLFTKLWADDFFSFLGFWADELPE